MLAYNLNFKTFLILSLGFIFYTGCSRSPQGSSELTIQTSHSSSGKVATLAALPSGRKACYGVSITGPGIPTESTSCSPTLGVVGGFVEAGAALSASVPKGIQRKIEIYLVLLAAGDTSPCPVLAQEIPKSLMDKVYLVGTTSNLELSKETETVTINSTFPGEYQNLVVQNSYASSCLPSTATVPNTRGFQVLADTRGSVSANYKVKGRIGRAQNGPILTSPSYQVLVK